MEGFSIQTRVKATKTYEEDAGQRGGKQYYLDLIDYRDAIRKNWELFSGILGEGSPNASKDKRTQWIVEVNNVRKIVSHASSGRRVTIEELNQMEIYWTWLQQQVHGKAVSTEVGYEEE